MSPDARNATGARKQFFFEKKNQKTFICLDSKRSHQSEAKGAKVFWFFFSKKNCFLPYSLLSVANPLDVGAAGG
jgi:hypothetical protein